MPHNAIEIDLDGLESLARERLTRLGLLASETSLLDSQRAVLASGKYRLNRPAYEAAQAAGIVTHSKLPGPPISPADHHALCLMLRDLGRTGRFWHEVEGRFVNATVPTALDIVKAARPFGSPPHPSAIRAAHSALGVELGSVPRRPGPARVPTAREVEDREIDRDASRDLEPLDRQIAVFD